MSEKFENFNGHKKRIKKNTDNDIYNTTEKTKDLATGIQQQSEIKCSEWVWRYCLPSGLLSLLLLKIQWLVRKDEQNRHILHRFIVLLQLSAIFSS